MSERILRSDAAGVCTLTLNRPDKLNALDTDAFVALDGHLSALETETDTVGCVVLRGSGAGFCAGADVKAIGSGSARPPMFKPAVIERLALLPQPTVAAVHGVCFTGALELALACDFIVADATARFADTHGRFGLVGAWGLIQRLPRRIGHAAAKRMMMTGEPVGAARAAAIGLVDELAAAGELDAAVGALVGPLLANSWFTNRAVKRLMIETDGMSLAEALAHEHYRHPGFAPDMQERIAAFGRERAAARPEP